MDYESRQFGSASSYVVPIRVKNPPFMVLHIGIKYESELD